MIFLVITCVELRSQRNVIESLLNKANAKTDKAKRIKEIKKELKAEQKETQSFAQTTKYLMKLLDDNEPQSKRLLCLVAFPVDSTPPACFSSQL
jgi:hypothetical protein